MYNAGFLELREFHINADTTKLSDEEEAELVNALERVNIDEMDNDLCDDELYFVVSPPDEPLFEDGDKWGQVRIHGLVTEDVFDELCRILDWDFSVDYDVTYYKEV